MAAISKIPSTLLQPISSTWFTVVCDGQVPGSGIFALSLFLVAHKLSMLQASNSHSYTKAQEVHEVHCPQASVAEIKEL